MNEYVVIGRIDEEVNDLIYVANPNSGVEETVLVVAIATTMDLLICKRL